MTNKAIFYPTKGDRENPEGTAPSFFKWLKDNPNNFSVWFPIITKLENQGISIPQSVVILLSIEETKAFFFDEGEKDEKRITDLVSQRIMPIIKEHFPEGDLFIKNGCFSNKFYFDKCCHVRYPFSEDDIQKHLCQIQYDSLCFDTCGAMEIVIREYIKAENSSVGVIYDGMPLRPEIRIFYDFDNHRLYYDVNYWDWNYCHEAIAGRSEEDKINYENEYPHMMKKFISRREKYLPLIEKSLATVTGLKGQWSVDFMLDEDKCWLIDMAIASQSAYYDPEKMNQ